jgi:hypothetical protein
VLKISNILNPDKMLRMNEQQFQDVADDVNLELVKFGEVQEYWIVKPYQASIGSNI